MGHLTGFSKVSSKRCLNGVLCDTGMVGTLDASYYDTENDTSPFIGALVEAFSGLHETVNCTRLFY